MMQLPLRAVSITKGLLSLWDANGDSVGVVCKDDAPDVAAAIVAAVNGEAALKEENTQLRALMAAERDAKNGAELLAAWSQIIAALDGTPADAGEGVGGQRAEIGRLRAIEAATEAVLENAVDAEMQWYARGVDMEALEAALDAGKGATP